MTYIHIIWHMGQYFLPFTYVLTAKLKTSGDLGRRHLFCGEQHFCLFDKVTQLFCWPLAIVLT